MWTPFLQFASPARAQYTQLIPQRHERLPTADILQTVLVLDLNKGLFLTGTEAAVVAVDVEYVAGFPVSVLLHVRVFAAVAVVLHIVVAAVAPVVGCDLVGAQPCSEFRSPQ